MIVQIFSSADRPSVMQLMRELQGHLAEIDLLHRIRKLDDFNAEAYIDHLLRQTKEEHGIILIAKEEDAIIGFIAGTIPNQDPNDALDHYPAKEGKIIELIVSQKHRGQGTGQALMRKMEDYFREKHCEYIRVGCFTPNTGTHAFYEKCGYADRYVEMLKKV